MTTSKTAIQNLRLWKMGMCGVSPYEESIRRFWGVEGGKRGKKGDLVGGRGGNSYRVREQRRFYD